ncbi:MAG: hypothetical protein Q4A46_07470 [Clostridia bacterium]|nr:hypothetical protein [Clostridia bacterium]
MKVTNLNGAELDFESTVDYMDDDIRESLHTALAPCSDQKFFTSYEKAHIEKFGEEWFLSSSNPCY